LKRLRNWCQTAQPLRSAPDLTGIAGRAQTLPGMTSCVKLFLWYASYATHTMQGDQGMPIIDWDDRFLLGIPQLDEHHRQLVKLLNQAFDGFTAKAPDRKKSASFWKRWPTMQPIISQQRKTG